MNSVTLSNPDIHLSLISFTAFSTSFSDTQLINIVYGHIFIFRLYCKLYIFHYIDLSISVQIQ